MWAFLGSDCLFFGSLVATYLVYYGRSKQGPTPHEIFNIPFTSVSTFVLLMSSLAIVLALANLQRGSRRGLAWLGVTVFLGTWFVAGQGYEFSSFVSEGLTIPGSLFGSTFYVLTGFHGAHVTIGLLWLMGLIGKGLKTGATPEFAYNVEYMSLYWHFVDVVWIVIFTVVYLIGAAP
ncbi:MAG: cytochrome c oxidase subunit 3 [Chloroflexi bacterium]|nr:cytochrome c oxidase subunit 3 [Chloroflexota bacterium]